MNWKLPDWIAGRYGTLGQPAQEKNAPRGQDAGVQEYRSSGEEDRIQKPEVSIQKSGICTGKLTPTLTLVLA
jgi:hypothetical protein